MNSRRLPTDLAMRMHNAAVGHDPVYNSAANGIEVRYDVTCTLHVCKHSNQPCSVIFVNFYNFFQQWRHYVATCQLSAQEIVNWVTTADGCVHTYDTTKLLPTSCEFVYTPPTRRDSTVSSRRRCVLGLTVAVAWSIRSRYSVLTIAVRLWMTFALVFWRSLPHIRSNPFCILLQMMSCTYHMLMFRFIIVRIFSPPSCCNLSLSRFCSNAELIKINL